MKIFKKIRDNSGESDGQSMVEFLFILSIIMALCVGMLASMRLLTFHFWAMQDARFLAFEQTWAPAEDYGNAEDGAKNTLANRTMGKPKVVKERTIEKTIEDAGSASNLLAFNKIEESKQNPLWNQTSTEWLASVERSIENKVPNFVEIAEATSGIRITDEENKIPMMGEATHGESELGNKIISLLEKNDFGALFCSKMKAQGEKYQNLKWISYFEQSDCAAKQNRGFGNHIARNVDIREIYLKIGNRIEDGFTPKESVKKTLKIEIKDQYYSFFDNLVKIGRLGSIPKIALDRVTLASDLSNSSVTRLVTDSRYLGSGIAMVALLGEAVNIGLSNPSNDALAFEQDVTSITQINAEEAIPVLNPFYLSPLYLPIPPTFGALGLGMQEAVMKNVLSLETDLKEPLIEKSNHEVEVKYSAEGGLFSAAVKKLPGIEAKELSSKYYLITQPWHITRRISPTGDYREKGDQFSDTGDDNEEGMLRRRVSGLWLFPSDPGAFLEPITLIPGLGFLAPVTSIFESVGGFIGTIKNLILVNNPLFEMFDALSNIPVLGAIVPTIPKFPAVRPDSYPTSDEMTGNSAGSKDKLNTHERKFKDYIDEQREFNPPPMPVYHD